MTKPDKTEHYEAIKGCMLKVVDHELGSNSLTAEYAAVGTMAALEMIDDYLTRNLLFFDHTFYNNCVLIYKDMFIPISYGVGGKVFLTVNDNDLKRVIEHPDIKKMMMNSLKK